EDHPGLQFPAPSEILATHAGISHGRGLSASWRTNPTESLYPLIRSSHRWQASAWLRTTDEYRIFSKHRHSFGRPYLSGTEAEQPVRQVSGLLGFLGQDRELSPEVGSSCFAWRCAMKGIASRLIELGMMLAQGPEGRCFSCTRSFAVSESQAKVAHSA